MVFLASAELPVDPCLITGWVTNLQRYGCLALSKSSNSENTAVNLIIEERFQCGYKFLCRTASGRWWVAIGRSLFLTSPLRTRNIYRGVTKQLQNAAGTSLHPVSNQSQLIIRPSYSP
jgi:hypothetical protein